MLDDKYKNTSSAASDPVTVGFKIAAIEPVRRRRGDGAVHESRTLGRLSYVWMPSGRPSFWHGELTSSDFPKGLKIVCEVEGDEPPGSDHAACLVAIRRRLAKDTAASVPLMRARLREMRLPDALEPAQLRLAGVHLPARPMMSARLVLEYRIDPAPKLLFMVVFLHGKPTAVHVDSDA
jgi:hypothetical protein